MENTTNINNKRAVVHNFDNSSKQLFSPKYLAVLIILVLLGIGAGYFFTRQQNTSVNATLPTATNKTVAIKAGDVFGANDTSAFKDTAEGQLEVGGVGDEGQYHLVRPGGSSQYVYLTSSTVDLSKLVGRNVKVWGATQKAQNVGWLMEVGKVQVE
jgi:hypothetical protein